ncbi:hypothetical protein Tco_1337337 [Tanacetum coccineum]
MVHVKFEISSWRGARVDVRTYLLGGAIDGSEANGIIRDPKLELESSRFTFDLVPLSYESVDVVVGENWLLRHKAEMVCHEKVVKMPCVPKELVGFTPRRRIGFRMELVQGATPICEGSCRLTSLERQEVWNDCRSCKVRVGSNGNLLWEASVLLGRKKGGVHGDDVAKTVFRMRNGHVEVYGYAFWVNQCTSGFHGVNEPGGVRVAREDDRGVTEGREDVREVFQQRGSGAKRKLSRCGRNQMGNEPILALPEGADDFVVYYDARSKDLEACLEKGEGDCLYVATTEDVAWLRPTSVKRDREWFILVRQGSDLHLERCKDLAIEEAYTTKYSIHPGADTMLCGFRLTNRWLSMKEDIASCGSKEFEGCESELIGLQGFNWVKCPQLFVATDDERTESDDEEEEKQDDEYFERCLKDAKPANKEKGDVEMTNTETGDAELKNVNQEGEGNQVKDDAQATHNTEGPIPCSSISSDYAAKYLNFDNIPSVYIEVVSILDINVQHEVPRTSPLLTILVSVIPIHTVVNPPEIVKTTSSATISSLLSLLLPHLQKLTPIPTPKTTEATTLTTDVPVSETLTVPKAVKEYLGTSLDDSLQKVLKKHSADLAKEHFVPAEVQEPKATITSSDTSALEEFDQKTTLFQTMTNSKSFNRSPKQRALYHALMESILEDEDAMDEGVADKLKKRKQDDADKDKGPSAGSDQGLKRQKTSKDYEPSKKAKSTEAS